MCDISKTKGAVFLLKVDKAIDYINNYKSAEHKYYASKRTRIDALTMKPLDIVTEILIIVMEHEGPQPIQGIAGRLGTILGYKDIFEGIQTASELISVVCFSDLYDIIPAKDSTTGSLMVKSNFSLEEKTKQFLANTKYLPPMLVEPLEIVDNRSCGYLTKTESIILGKMNHHDKPLALDVLNISNKIALSLDRSMLRFHEVSKKPLDSLEKVDNHRRMVNSSKVVYKELLEQGNKFYLTWRPDKRGRVYSQGYHVNLQSTSYKKAMINLHEKHLITGV